MRQILKNDWNEYLATEFDKPYYQLLRNYLIEAYRNRTIYPDLRDIFNALHFTPARSLKILILGQDPYHGAGQAHGLAFSVKPGVKVPPSLRNIYKELATDVNFIAPAHGYLKDWADQGVMLLNTVLTVEQNNAHSHRDIGWQYFTDAVIQAINRLDQPIVVMLWGKSAQSKARYLNNPQHLVLCAAHPSPLSAYRGFFGCRHFSKANRFLVNHQLTAIDWQLRDLGAQFAER